MGRDHARKPDRPSHDTQKNRPIFRKSLILNIKPNASRMLLLLAIFASIAMLIIFSDARQIMAARGYYDDYLGYEGIPNRGGWRATLR